MSLEGTLVAKDLALFKEIKEGSTAAFKRLFLRYYDKLHAFTLTLTSDSFLAEDAVQEVFIRLWEKRDTICIHSSVQYYLYRSCRNTLFNLSQRKSNRAHLRSCGEDEPAGGENPADLLSYKILDDEFRNAVSQLPEKAREVFLLRYYHQHKHRDIASQLNISESMVEKHWANALRHLRKKLAAHFFQ